MRVVSFPKKPWKPGRPPKENPAPFLVLTPIPAPQVAATNG